MSLPHVRAFIFDLDGTLADSLSDIGLAMNVALESVGLPTHRLESYRSMVGEGAEVLVQKATNQASLALQAQVIERYRGAYAQRAHQLSFPFPGIVSLLQALTLRCVPMAVLSNKRDAFTKHLIATRFADIPFVAVWGERAEMPRKPHPQAALALCADLKVPAHQVAFVGDTAVDVLTAHNAGMTSVGVSWGFRGEDELRAAGAHHVVNHPQQILTLSQKHAVAT
jgi:phosphoglycolate phosphatase